MMIHNEDDVKNLEEGEGSSNGGTDLEECEQTPKSGNGGTRRGCHPSRWLAMLAMELHWSFLFGVITVYGIGQGLGGGIGGVATDYYFKDVQKVSPSVSEFYQGISTIPWIVKPIWGMLTDVVHIAGYRRKPYFLIAGALGIISTLALSLHSKLQIAFAVLAMTALSASGAIADVTIDALAAENSTAHPSLASDIQSLNAFSSSIGGLLGFSISGFLVHLLGPQGALGLMSISSVLLISVGILLKETHIPSLEHSQFQVHRQFLEAGKAMWTGLKRPEIWRPCVYMFGSLAISLDLGEGMFYWLTDPSAGLSFSEGFLGFIYAVGSVGALLGVLLYQNYLKDYPFRGILFWSQLLAFFAGMLDLMLVLRVNLKLGVPDYIFVVVDSGVSRMVGNLKWLPLMVLSSKLCPPGIEGTFFALIMSIDNAGLLMSALGGSSLLRALNITRSEFSKLWAAVLIRNATRLLPLSFLFLVPASDQNSTILPADMLMENGTTPPQEEEDSVQLVPVSLENSPSNIVSDKERLEVSESELDDADRVPLIAQRT